MDGLIFSNATARWWINGDFQWVATTEAEGFEAGTILQLDASIMYRLLTYPERNDLFLVFEVNSISQGNAKRSGVELDNTGGNTVFLSPGIEFFLRRNWVLEFSAQIPMHQVPNGTQLARDWILVTGFRFLY